MASLYKNNGTYYLSVSLKGKRRSRSLGTRELKTAKKLKPFVEFEILKELHGVNEKRNELSFPELVELYLSTDHDWAKSTIELKTYILYSFLDGKSLPTNITSKAIHIRTINSCWNWGLKKGHITKAKKLDGNTKGEARTRVFNKDELKMIFTELKDNHFNSFVRFAYYTGARSGEIRRLNKDQIHNGIIEVIGKTGKRFIKLNNQAQHIICNTNTLWSYSKDYVTHKFKNEMRKLNISDARFHDLRRTFGFNLIKSGMDIYKVSKLLGHKSIKTTEEHYSPLTVMDIKDFVI